MSTTTTQPLPITADIEIDAPVEAVWAVVSDVRRMPEFSPELRRVVMLGRKRGLGAQLVGINRRKAVVWPTRSKVVRWEPGRAVAWRTIESGATWVYELEPLGEGDRPRTRLTGRRVLTRYTLGSRLLTPVLGGAAGHDRELAEGIAHTLARIKAVVEG